MIWFLVRGRVRIKIRFRFRVRVRVGVTFNINIYHRSNCRTFVYPGFKRQFKVNAYLPSNAKI